MRVLSSLGALIRGIRLPPQALDPLRRAVATQRHALVPAFGILAAALIVAAATVLLAQRMQRSAAEGRAAAEATSFAEHSSWLATGDAFAGYIQLLRYADDPEIRARVTPSDFRTAAMRRQLELNTNRFSSLAVVTLDGQVVAATDTTMLDAVNGAAFAAVRANRGNANSDIVLPAPGIDGYVDYASILVDPSGEKWAALIARGDPDRLWQSTLSASIDAGRNVIINREGQVAAGVPAEQIGRPWAGTQWKAGAIRARIDGTDSICGLAAIAANTQIDHGWNVASCLPAKTVIAGGAGGRLGAYALAVAAVVASAAGAAVLFLAPRGGPAATGDVMPDEEQAPEAEPDIEPEAAPVPPPPNIDARTLIEAYEARNARLALRVRESVQARLLVTSSRVEEAVEVHEEDPPLARVMLERASHELDDLNEHELRAIGQELHPDLVRLGLPTALRALQKDIADDIAIEVDADADADSLDETSEHAIDPALRTVMYRFVLDTVRQFEEAGLGDCSVTLRRRGLDLWLAVRGHGEARDLEAPSQATALAVEAYGGVMRLDIAAEAVEAALEFGVTEAPAAAASDEPADDLIEEEAETAGEAAAA